MAKVSTASSIFFSVLLGFNVFASAARAGVIVVATDDPQTVVATRLANLIKTTPPFSRLPHLHVNVVYRKIDCPKPKNSMQSYEQTAREYYEKWAKLNHQPESAVDQYMAHLMPESCKKPSEEKKTAANLERTFVCDNADELQAMKKEFGADMMIFLRNSKTYGGSGGPVPMASTTGPIALGLHEMLHTIGFDDEYAHYTACEADLYCRADHKAVNIFEADPATYTSENEAREKLKSIVPWDAEISTATEITKPAANGGVALGSTDKTQIGIFPAKTCKLATSKIQAWRSTTRTSVMESLQTNYIPEATWPTIATALKDQISNEPGPGEKVYSVPKKAK